MTLVARRTDPILNDLADKFGGCPEAVERIRRAVGDTGELLEFWFDFALGDRHAVFYRFRRDGRTETSFERLEKKSG